MRHLSIRSLAVLGALWLVGCDNPLLSNLPDLPPPNAELPGNQSPPEIVSLELSAVAVKVGDTLTIEATASQPIDRCSATVAAFPASCSATDDTCSCSLSIPGNISEGAVNVSLSVTNAGGTGTDAVTVFADLSPPIITAAFVSLSCGALEVLDALQFAAGSVADNASFGTYDGQGVALLQVWGNSLGQTLLGSRDVGSEGLGLIELAGTERQGPTQLWVTATDAVGNESEPLELTEVFDLTAPTINASEAVLQRNAVGAKDTFLASAAVASDDCAVAALRLFASASGGGVLAEVDAMVAEAFNHDVVGTEVESPPELWLSAVDKYGNQSERVAVPEAAAIAVPVVDVDQISIERRGFGEVDGVLGQAAAVSASTAQVWLFAEGSYDVPVATLVGPFENGAFVEAPVGTVDLSVQSVRVVAMNKVGQANAAAAAAPLVLNGRDVDAPVVAASELRFFANVSEPDVVEMAEGAVHDPSAVRYEILPATGSTVLAQGTLERGSGTGFLPLVREVGDTNEDTVRVVATDKAGNAAAPATVSRVTVELAFDGKPRHDSTEVAHAAYGFGFPSAAQSLIGPGHGHVLGEEPHPGYAALLAADNDALVTLGHSETETVPLGWYAPGQSNLPNSRNGHGIAFDAHERVVVLTNSWVVHQVEPESAWRWDGSDWTAEPWTLGYQFWGGAAFDAIFGGTLVAHGSLRVRPAFGTWESVASHSGTGYPGVVYDAGRARTVIAGGNKAISTCTRSVTEVVEGTVGSFGAAPVLPVRNERMAIAYDARRALVVLYGGRDHAAGTCSGTTVHTSMLTYDGSAWIPVAQPHPNPGFVVGATMEYDYLRDRLVLTGGSKSNQVWEYNAADNTWSFMNDPDNNQLAGNHSATSGEGFVMTYDGVRREMVGIGGQIGSGDHPGTWVYRHRTPAASVAAQLFRFKIPESVDTNGDLELDIIYRGWSPAVEGSSGVQLLRWDWAGRAWESAELSPAGAASSPSADRAVNLQVSATSAQLDGWMWLMAVSRSESLVGEAASLSTDRIAVKVTPVLP